MDISYIFLILILALDIAVLRDVMRLRCTLISKILYSLIVLLIPILGVSIYYLFRKR